MALINRQEVIHLAQSSQLLINESEIDALLPQLQAVLEYAAAVQQIGTYQSVKLVPTTDTNVLRQDKVHESNYQAIMACAPVKESNCFVVPMILEKK